MRVRAIIISLMVFLFGLLFFILTETSGAVLLPVHYTITAYKISLYSILNKVLIYLILFYVPRLFLNLWLLAVKKMKRKSHIVFWHYPFIYLRGNSKILRPLELLSFQEVTQKSFLYQKIIETEARESKHYYYVYWIYHEVLAIFSSICFVFFFNMFNEYILISIFIYSLCNLFVSFISFHDFRGILLLIKEKQIRSDVYQRYLVLCNPEDYITYQGADIFIHMERLFVLLLFHVNDDKSAGLFLEEFLSMVELQKNESNASSMAKMKFELDKVQLEQLSGIVGKERKIESLVVLQRGRISEMVNEYSLFNWPNERGLELLRYYESEISWKEIRTKIVITSILLNTQVFKEKYKELKMI